MAFWVAGFVVAAENAKIGNVIPRYVRYTIMSKQERKIKKTA